MKSEMATVCRVGWYANHDSCEGLFESMMLHVVTTIIYTASSAPDVLRVPNLVRGRTSRPS